MTHPYETVYRLFPDRRQLEYIIAAHLNHGFIYSTALFFVCGRPVNSHAPAEQITDMYQVFDPDVCDAWFVMLVAGDLGSALQIMPWYLPIICFERDFRDGKGLRFHSTDRIQQLTRNLSHGLQTKSIGTRHPSAASPNL